MGSEKNLSSYLGNKDNNFNLIRFLAASLVLFSHSYVLGGFGSSDFLSSAVGISFGGLAVDIFFLTSGLLIAGSYYARNDLLSFTKARLLRIYPALIVAVLFSVIVVGGYFTSLSLTEYFSENETWRYARKNSTLYSSVWYHLPGVFESNPYPKAVNGSLWTLPYELKSYAFLAIGAWLMGKVKPFKEECVRRWVYLIAGAGLIGATCFNYVSKFTDFEGLRLYAFFFLGAACYAWRERINLKANAAIVISILLLTIFILGGNNIIARYVCQVCYVMFIPYLILVLAYLPKGKIRLFNKSGDYSYGIYIYAFPIQQGLIVLCPNISFSVYNIVGFAITLGLAILSWHLVEKRCLKFGRKKKVQI